MFAFVASMVTPVDDRFKDKLGSIVSGGDVQK